MSSSSSSFRPKVFSTSLMSALAWGVEHIYIRCCAEHPKRGLTPQARSARSRHAGGSTGGLSALFSVCPSVSARGVGRALLYLSFYLARLGIGYPRQASRSNGSAMPSYGSALERATQPRHAPGGVAARRGPQRPGCPAVALARVALARVALARVALARGDIRVRLAAAPRAASCSRWT